jgi:hypothetical protein
MHDGQAKAGGDWEDYLCDKFIDKKLEGTTHELQDHNAESEEPSGSC